MVELVLEENDFVIPCMYSFKARDNLSPSAAINYFDFNNI